MTPRLLSILVLTPGIVAGAAPAAPPPREVRPYFPTTVGTKWVYEHTRRGVTEETVEVVTAVTPRPTGAKVVSVGAPHDGEVLPLRTVEVSDQGLVWTGAYGGLFDRPVQLLKLPHRPGQTWGRYPQDPAKTMTARGPDRVTVPAGEFDCIRVEYRPDREVTQIRWYARGVGDVKLFVQDPLEKDGTLDIHLVLKSFTPGKGRAP